MRMNKCEKQLLAMVNRYVLDNGRSKYTEEDRERFIALSESAKQIPLDPRLTDRQRAIYYSVKKLSDQLEAESRNLNDEEKETFDYLLEEFATASNTEAELTPAERAYAGSVQYQKLSNRQKGQAGAKAIGDQLTNQLSEDCMYKTWEAEAAAEDRAEQVADIKTTARLSRGWLIGNGYGVLLNAIDTLSSASAQFEIERAEESLQDAMWLKTQRRCGVSI
jgi:hypothetical protein